MGLSLRGQTSGAVDINAPAVAGDNTITLPDGNGSANQFYKNSTTAGIVTHSSMIELANGRIGIGTDNPGTSFEVSSDTAGVARFKRNEGSGQWAKVNIVAGRSDGNSYITFGDPDSTESGAINYEHGDDTMRFEVWDGSAKQERLRITGFGTVSVNTTSSPVGVNVAVGGTVRVIDTTDATQYLTIDHLGIDFQNTGAGSSDAVTSHLLDDYEEGSWTPVLGVSDGNSTHDQANQLGFYVKVGRKVTVWGRAQISNLNNNGNGVCSMNGLPFRARTSALTEGGPTVVFSEGFDTNFVPQATRLNTNSDKLTFVCFGGADRERITSTLGSGRYTSTSEIMIQGSYYTD